MKIDIKELIEFDHWANTEVIKFVTVGNIADTGPLKIMSHIINAYKIWLSRIQSLPQNAEVWHTYGKDEINNAYLSCYNEILNLISKSDFNPEKIISYTNSKSEKFDSSVKDILIHLLNHSSYHRGQIKALLSSYSLDFPYIDYIHYARKIKSLS